MAPPAPQRMPQQPDKVVALGKPVLQHMREPAMRYPNNVLYPGQPVGMRASWAWETMTVILYM